MEGFLAHWGLDDGARSLMMQLTPEQQERVLSSFAPKPGTRDVNKLLHGFVKSIGGAPAGQPAADPSYAADPGYVADAQYYEQDQDAVRDQCSAWCNEKGLDMACLDTLVSLTPEHREAVMVGYAPKGEIRNPVGQFMSYVRSMGTGAKGAKGAGKASKSVAKGPPATKGYVDFGSTRHVQDIRFQAAVAPSHGPVGGKGKPYFAGAASKGGKAAKAPSAAALTEDELMQFLQVWGLDDEAAAILMERPAEVQREVLTTFAPKAGTRDIKKLFIGFLNSISRSARGNGVVHAPAAQPQTWAAEPAWEEAFQVSQEELTGFQQVWGLDSEAMAVLSSHRQEIQRAMLDRFQPRDGTRDCKALFHGFLKSLTGGKGKPKGGDAAHYAASGGKGWDGKGKSSAPKGGGIKRPASEAHLLEAQPLDQYEIDNFLLEWGLDEESQNMFWEQPPEVQRHVIERFKPKAETQDVSKLFKGFIRSFMYGPKARRVQ